jgi:hypothetical protein
VTEGEDLVRHIASLAEYERTGVSIPAAQVIVKLESQLAKGRKQLGG